MESGKLAVALREREAAQNNLGVAQASVDEAFAELRAQGIEVARAAFRRVAPAELEFIITPESPAALPASGDNIRYDVRIAGKDSPYNGLDLMDPETGITFRGFEVDGPVAGVAFQVRVPIAIEASTPEAKV